MGKVAGAALKIAAPEAAVAAKAAGGAKAATKHTRGNPGPLRHQPNDLRKLPPDWHEEELEARKHDAKWAADERKAGRDPDRASVSGDQADDATDGDTQADTDQGDQGDQGGAAAGPFGGMTVPATGSGFVLGLMTWALVRAYIGNGTTSGAAGVKALLMAKFFNKNPDGTYMARQVPAAAGTTTSGGGK